MTNNIKKNFIYETLSVIRKDKKDSTLYNKNYI